MRAAAGLNAVAHVGLPGVEQSERAEPDDDHVRRPALTVMHSSASSRLMRGSCAVGGGGGGGGGGGAITRRAMSILSVGCSVAIAPASASDPPLSSASKVT